MKPVDILMIKFGVDDLNDLSGTIEEHQHRTYGVERLTDAMKLYAEYYCEEFRKNLLNSGYHYENLRVVDYSTVETLPLHPHE